MLAVLDCYHYYAAQWDERWKDKIIVNHSQDIDILQFLNIVYFSTFQVIKIQNLNF
jgi:hypothetical protein